MKDLFTKKNIIILVVVLLLLTILGFTFAYFVGGIGSPAITDTSVTGEKTSRLIFTPGTPISIVASLDNFADGSGSLSGTTMSSAKLTSSSTENIVSDEYYVYYNIIKNNYVYSVNNSTPELILEVFDNEGNELTSIEGLSFVTTTDALTGETINGFDVTTYEGLIAIKENIPISSTHPTDTVHEWNLKITYLNLDSDQSLNEGREFNGEFILTSEPMSDIKTLSNLTLTNNGGTEAIEAKSTPDFSTNATTDEGMFSSPDGLGTSYYFRGAVNDNWVSFAGLYWRIIRINGDGSVRMIYSGTTAPIESEAVIMEGTKTEIGESPFSGSSQDITYSNSPIEYNINEWYSTNLNDYSNQLADSVFCNDTTMFMDEYDNILHMAAQERIVVQNTPSLVCQNNTDAFSVNTLIGNGRLTNPIGLITADEVALAGGLGVNTEPYNTSVPIENTNYYLYTNRNYFTISPSDFHGTEASFYSMFAVSNVGGMINDMFNPEYLYGVRPVISLKADTLATGSGLWNDPYIVS